MCQLVASKHRRTEEKKELIVRVRGNFSTVRGTGKKYMVDPTTRTIRERAEVCSTVSSVQKIFQVAEALTQKHPNGNGKHHAKTNGSSDL